MLGKIETEISKALEESPEEIIAAIDRIENTNSQDEIRAILSEYDEDINQFAIRQKQYLTEEEQYKKILNNEEINVTALIENIIKRNNELLSQTDCTVKFEFDVNNMHIFDKETEYIICH